MIDASRPAGDVEAIAAAEMTPAASVTRSRPPRTRRLFGKPAITVRRRLAARDRAVHDIRIRRVLLDARTVTLRGFIDGEADPVGPGRTLARADGDHETRAASRPDDHVLRVRWAVDEVPRAHLPLLAFDDQDRFARDDEEVPLIGLPLVDATPS